jgi:hypothetical protein
LRSNPNSEKASTIRSTVRHVDLVVCEVVADLVAEEAIHGVVDHQQAAAELPIGVSDLGIAELEGAVDIQQCVVEFLVCLDVEC